MKKVLIVTDLFYASPRIPGLCKYLSEFGWEATLLTTLLGEDPESRFGPPNDFAKKFRVVEVPYLSPLDAIKRLLGFTPGTSSRAQLEKKLGRFKLKFLSKAAMKLAIWVAALLAYPDEHRRWRMPAAKRGLELLRSEHFDAVLSSSSPVTSHRIAKMLKDETRLPWLADLRDLWTQNHYYSYPYLRKLFETRLEIKTLSSADALSAASEADSQKLRQRYKGTPAFVIKNGFDPEAINVPPRPLTKKFTITYTGTIYRGKQNPKKFLEALKTLLDSGLVERETVEVRFYGIPKPWLQEEIVRLNLEDVVLECGVISRSESFERQRESQVLLVFGWEDENFLGAHPTKVFEYFAARRPILLSGGTPKEELRELLDKTMAGRHATDVAGISAILYDYYREYKKKGAVGYHGIPQEMDKYSYREMARKFATALDAITSRSSLSKTSQA
jgi:glycosyltransferase involved in cell wall biosynthesis